jgi:hypothetical protein
MRIIKNPLLRLINFFRGYIFDPVIDYITYYILLDPKGISRILILYRIILFILAIYSYVYDNPNVLLEMLDSFLKNLTEEFYTVNIKISDLLNPLIDNKGPSNNDPSNPNPNPNPEAAPNPDNDDERSKRRRRRSRGEFNPGPVHVERRFLFKEIMYYGDFCYFDNEKRQYIYPEIQHITNPECLNNNKIRIYKEVFTYPDKQIEIFYEYNTTSRDRSKHYCLIRHPDYTTKVSKIDALGVIKNYNSYRKETNRF